jgi:transketolase
MEEQELGRLKAKAREVRKAVIEAIGSLGIGHIGGCMSIVETLVILYYRFLRIDPAEPRKPDRDADPVKGHAGPPGAILADLGFFPKIGQLP